MVMLIPNRFPSPTDITRILTEDRASDICDVRIPVVPGRLSITIHRDEEHTKNCIENDRKTFYFSSWMHESYASFCKDFGPVDISAVVQFCSLLQERLLDQRLKDRHLVYYCDLDAAYYTNLIFLMGAFLVLVEGQSPEDAANQFSTINPIILRTFRDVSDAPSTFELTLLDCLCGLKCALNAGFLRIDHFDVQQFDLLADPTIADLSLVCPKLIAFRGPLSSKVCTTTTSNTAMLQKFALSPSHYVPILKDLQVSAVVRLNDSATYQKEDFERCGIAHHDLYFKDMSAPSLDLVERFHRIVDSAPGPVAVHCMAGLGRTGTMIATWIMRRYGWTARAAMAWLRISRPGSVIGQQQHFLLWYEGLLQRS